MQKNLVLAVVLSSAVYILWFAFIEKPKPKPVSAAAQGAQAPGAPAPAQPAAPGAAGTAAAAPVDWHKSAVEVKLARSAYFFSSADASIKSIVFQGPVAPLELVPDPHPGFLGGFDGLAFQLKEKTADTVAFAAQVPGGLVITKKFTLKGENAISLLEVTARNDGDRPVDLPAWNLKLGPGLGTVESEQKENPDLWKAQYTVREKGKKHPVIKKLKETGTAGEWLWAGINNRYFLAAVLGEGLERGDLILSEPKVKNEKAPLLAIPFKAIPLMPKESRAWRVEFFIGPKDYALLQRLGHGLDRSVDFGFFSPLAKLANSALGYFHGLTGNYGHAIVILSVILQIVLTPLSAKSYKAMAVMKKIQPEMQSIQTRYKNDPQRLNKEILELYKRHGTNPLGGCLPMLLQIPVFFALFTALRESWNLHGAPFIFWITDLSAKDPYYVLPLVMGGIMFLQQHLNPQGGDPTQAAMMKWMPVLFTFMFLTFPSGLVLYWLINSVWGFAQTMYMKRHEA